MQLGARTQELRARVRELADAQRARQHRHQHVRSRYEDSADVYSPFKELEWADDEDGSRLLSILIDDLVDEAAEDLREMLEDEIEERLYDRY